MNHFDLLNSPLEGRNLIEASAGTGKTYTIAGLYLRLLLEKRLSVDQILVVTFTVAATEELRGRIRTRIKEALDAFTTLKQPPLKDDFLAGLVKRCGGSREAGDNSENGSSREHQNGSSQQYGNVNNREARILLTNALRCFDEAAVFTIHGFCQRTLQEKAFECGSVFNTELATDQSALVQEVVDDFWRIHIYTASPGFISFIRSRKNKGWNPDSLASFAERSLSKFNLRVIPEIDLQQIPERDCIEALDQMRRTWPQVRAEVEDLLLSSKCLNRNKYRLKSIPGWIEDLDQYLSVGSLFPCFDKLEKFTACGLEDAAKKGCQPPQHRFFNLTDTLHTALKELEAAFDRQLLALKRKLLTFVREELPVRKQQQNIRSFDDLLLSLQAALERGGGSALARTISEKYRAALIDEFQDTDPVQYAIFKTVYPNTKAPLTTTAHPTAKASPATPAYPVMDSPATDHPAKDSPARDTILFLIGDPKQAIYSFRGADLFAYLEAAGDVEARYTLSTNWRSTPDLIRAVNTIFSNRDHPFMFRDISFNPVKPPPEKKPLALDDDRQAGAQQAGAQPDDEPQGNEQPDNEQRRGAHLPGTPADNQADGAPLQIWFMDRGGSNGAINKGEAEENLPEAVATEIGRLLKAGQTGEPETGEPGTGEPGTGEPGTGEPETDAPGKGKTCGDLLIDGRPVAPQDIAVLVRTNRQARAVQYALQRRGIPSVLYSSESLFASREAVELLRILSAVADPANEGKIKAAMTTDLMGVSGNELASLIDNDAAWEMWLEKFRSYHDLWSRRQGFMTMARTLAAREKMKSRSLAYPDGERRTANLLHCLEVLHQASLENNLGMEGLLKWFVRQIKERPEKEEYQIRLETDEKAVRLVTIHKSKGLEYPIVFCPYCWSGSREKDKEMVFFHDPEKEHQATLVLGSQNLGPHKPLAEREILAENLRLLYVALTRARQRCYLVWGAIRDSETSAPAYLFHPCDEEGAEEEETAHNSPLEDTAAWVATLDDQKMLKDLETLARKAKGSIRISPIPPPSRETYTASEMETEGLRCRTFSGHIPDDWRMASFSSLVSGKSEWWESPGRDENNQLAEASQEAQVLQSAPNTRAVPSALEDPQKLPEVEQDNWTILDFPRGASAGTCLHGILERLDFAERATEVIEKLVRERLAASGFDEAWTLAVCSMLDRVLNTPLLSPLPGTPLPGTPAPGTPAPGTPAAATLTVPPKGSQGSFTLLKDGQGSFTLSSLGQKDGVRERDHVREMEFYLPLDRITAARMGKIFAACRGPELPEDFAYMIEKLKFSPARGMLKGYIDLVFCFDGRYYVVDYKSNYLGPRLENYDTEALAEAMKREYYLLQAHLYTVGLHKYLARRVPDYDYQTHFGGVIYIFLRGVDPAHGSRFGIYRSRPSKTLIDALDRYFTGREEKKG